MSLKQGVSSPSSLDLEVLSVFVPPFVSKDDSQMAGAPSATLSKTRRRSFRKKRDKPKTEPWKGLPPEDISVPNGVDLLGLPQLCFPGIPRPAFPTPPWCFLETKSRKGDRRGAGYPWQPRGQTAGLSSLNLGGLGAEGRAAQ